MVRKPPEAKASEPELLRRVCDEAKETIRLTDEHVSRLSKVLGERFDSACRTLRESRVKKYVFRPSGRIVWVVVGRERDYQVIPASDFCTCDDFYFRVIDHEVRFCYHLIAQRLAEALGQYDLIEEADELYEPLMREWRAVEVKKRGLPRMEMEGVRRASEVILIGRGGLTIRQLLNEVQKTGFDVLNNRHLAVILASDPKRRFRCENGVWSV